MIEQRKILYYGGAIPEGQPEYNGVETTMEWMADFIETVHSAMAMAAEMKEMDTLFKAINLLDWAKTDIYWHIDGEYGGPDDEGQYWEAAIHRMTGHGLLEEARVMEEELQSKYNEWRKENPEEYLTSHIEMR